MFDPTYFMFVVKPIVGVFLIALFTTIAVIATKKTLSYLKRVSKNDWVISLCDVLSDPAKWIIIGIGVFIGVEVLLHIDPLLSKKIATVRYLFIISTATWLIFRWKSRFEGVIADRILSRSKNKKNDQIIISAVSKIVTIALSVVSGLMFLDIVGVPLQGLLAFGGVSGIAISWAAKDIVANFFGGFMIYVNRPFVIGDWIKSPNKNFEGTVEDIGWYMTCIRTFEKRPMYIPNALITDAIVENPGRMSNRRIKFMLSLRYSDINRVEAVANDVEQMLRDSSDIDQNQTIRVNLAEFNAYSVDLEVYAFTKVTGGTDFRRVRQKVLLSIAEIVSKNGAGMPFPTTTLEIEKVDLQDVSK